MPFCSFGENAAMFDMTPIENMFLLEYMPAAPRDYVCVYLYARMLCLHPELGGSLQEMTRALNMDEDSVFEAFAYWERQGLAERISDNPPAFALRPVRSAIERGKQVDRTMYTYREFDYAIQSLFGGENVEARYRVMANDWLTVFGFSQEAALMLLEYELKLPGGKKQPAVFRRANKRAADWAERGIKSADDVRRAIEGEDRVYRLAVDVLKKLSIRRAPTEAERVTARRWLEEWHYTEQDVLDACSQTTNARDPSFAYINKILQSRHENGASQDTSFAAVRGLLQELGASSKEPTPNQLERYAQLLAQGFEPKTMQLAAVQCARRDRHRFEDLLWMLGRWGELGLMRYDVAEKYVADMQQRIDEVRPVLEQAGLTRRPTMDDLDRYAEWKKKYAPDMIACAAQYARGTRAPMPYIAKLLETWQAEGITTPQAVAARPKPKSPAPKDTQKFDYQQHEYKNEDFGRDRFNELERLYGDGGDAK